MSLPGLNNQLISCAQDLSNMNVNDVASLLQRLNKQERFLLMGLNLWNKDEFEPDIFSNWILPYYYSSDKIKEEFLQGQYFALFLKGAFTISTFDVENPSYPEHDNYFLTDDSSFLIEYNDNFHLAKELKELISFAYAQWGVHRCYNFFLAIISASFTELQEKLFAYYQKEAQEVGISDYYQAMSTIVPFSSIKVMNNFIKNRKVLPFKNNLTMDTLPSIQMNQAIKSALQELTDQDRLDFLHYNWAKLFNDYIIYFKLHQKGKLALQRKVEQIESYLSLGWQYMQERERNILVNFDFIDLARIGKTLLIEEKNRLKLSINLSFAGTTIKEFMEEFIIYDKFCSPYDGCYYPLDLANYKRLVEINDQLISFLPLLQQFEKNFNQLIAENKISNHFYCNYQIDEIDLEIILLTTFVNHLLLKDDQQSLGVTPVQLQNVLNILVSDDDQSLRSKGEKIVQQYAASFKNKFMQQYFVKLVKDYFLKSDFRNYKEDQFKYFGGVLLFNVQ